VKTPGRAGERGPSPAEEVAMLEGAGVLVASGSMTVKRLGGALGVEIGGVDLSRPIDDATGGAIRRALDEHLVLVFRDQDLTPAQQIAFTRLFGPVEPHPLYKTAQIEGYPEVLVIEHKDGKFYNGRNDIWHADVTFLERPPLGSVLHCRAIDEGYGDTLFASVVLAYQRLSPGLRQLLDGLHAEHSAGIILSRNNRESYNVPIADVAPPVVHPVVRTEPGTGRKALFVNPTYAERFVGMTDEESRPLLQYLFRFATQPEFVYRHRWRVGDVVMFDNRGVWHYVSVDYPPTMHRRMHRTTASGERPV
jgi:taurine dioxygenase